MSGSAAGGAVGTSGTAARYSLSGDEKTISPHLNHQVEITGTLDSGSAGAGAGAPSAGAGAGASAGGASAAGPTLKVESVKMVSATCQQ